MRGAAPPATTHPSTLTSMAAAGVPQREWRRASGQPARWAEGGGRGEARMREAPFVVRPFSPVGSGQLVCGGAKHLFSRPAGKGYRGGGWVTQLEILLECE